MRLTLRTMLAYMDGILDPEDAEKIGKKLEESEFAANLLHRTRDVMRRLRLAAPKLADGGQGLDANTVAEYLDNTLHHDRVTDFEKICLDSDVHLAEVAACHQILALVLGEAAEIDPTARERMYALPERPADESAATVEPPPVQAVADNDSTRHKPSVPDYLRDPPKKRRLLPVAAVLVLVGCFAVVVLIAMGQFEPDKPLGKALARMGFGEEADQVADASDDDRDGDKPNGAESIIPPNIPSDDTPGDDVMGDVVPGDVVPGDVVPGDDVPGDVVPGDVVPGDVVPG
ncbi:MAG: hypothetical protein HQ567_00155, partial [Candidatus Nealsonbacteria bacterium]|nr:hypothetical protein [Candidatus Nealsonbacteria bacterium]